jgi:hypothetical protein
MRRFGLSFLAVLLALTTAQIAAAKGGKKGPEKVKGPAPIAKAAEIKELKGELHLGHDSAGRSRTSSSRRSTRTTRSARRSSASILPSPTRFAA